MKHKILLATAAMIGFATVQAQQPDGGLSADFIQSLRESYKPTPAEKALHNAIAGTDISKLAVNSSSLNNFDTHFSHRVKSKGITDQKSSGRCWLFTGLNVLRAEMMTRHNLAELKLSHNYNFFWDQLEKANLFLQGIIDTADRPMSDKMVDWLFHNPLNDGGQFTGISDNLMKYGVVPAEVMLETYSSNHTSAMSRLIGLKLKEYALELRTLKRAKAINRKKEMLTEVYRMLALALGEPPTSFTWTMRDRDGKVISTKTYTPQSFYAEMGGKDLRSSYVMLMNDPSREFYKLYEIDYDRHAYDGQNWVYINLPIEEIKQMAIASIKDNTMMYFSCDVGKFFDRSRGVLDVDYYDYGSLLGTTFDMDKKDRIRTFSSGSSHAMTLMAVDLDENGKPLKWMVENSWGPGANDGHLIMTDRWFEEYMFRLVVDKKYLTPTAAKVLGQKPIRLPAWDPMFAAEQ